MSIQPTASKTDLLIGCARPFSKGIDTERNDPGEAAEYGTEWHRGMAIRIACREDEIPEAPRDELLTHIFRAWAVLAKWLEGKNPWNEAFEVVGIEVSQAMRIRHTKSPHGIVTRPTTLDEETHTYALEEEEIGGTYDLLLRGAASGRIVVLDHKTGDYGDFHCPTDLPQMRTLALMTGASGVAILHSPREAPTVIYAEDISPEILQAHAKELRKAMGRIDDGSMRPGPWCKYCPAKVGCPAKDGELLSRASAIVCTVTQTTLAAPVDKGRFHLFLAELAALEKRAREELRASVAAGEYIQRPDGKVLVLRSKTTERLSKASVIRALGPAKGEKMLEKLRKVGAIEEETHDELWAVNEK